MKQVKTFQWAIDLASDFKKTFCIFVLYYSNNIEYNYNDDQELYRILMITIEFQTNFYGNTAVHF
jgi:hypothetical protein